MNEHMLVYGLLAFTLLCLLAMMVKAETGKPLFRAIWELFFDNGKKKLIAKIQLNQEFSVEEKTRFINFIMR